MLRGETASHRSETVSGIRNFRCIRTHEYKLIENYNDVTELYDLIADRKEEHNIAEQHPDLRRELSRRLSARYTEGHMASVISDQPPPLPKAKVTGF